MESRKPYFHRVLVPKLATFVGMVALCLLPFSGVLEIHHVFAEVDHDGHEHSEFDICQWVQQHANGLHVFQKPLSEVFALDINQETFISEDLFVPTFEIAVETPRPPPLS